MKQFYLIKYPHPYNETEVEQQRHKRAIALDKILLSDRHSVLYVM